MTGFSHYIVTASSLGAAITMPICGFLIAHFGWESAFYFTGMYELGTFTCCYGRITFLLPYVICGLRTRECVVFYISLYTYMGIEL